MCGCTIHATTLIRRLAFCLMIVIVEVGDVLGELISTLTPKAPATTGAFYFFNHSKSSQNAIQYLAPSPTSAAKLEPLCLPQIILIYFHPQQSQSPPHFTTTDKSISPTQLPNTSLPVAITDAICSSKSHRYLMPLFRDLIEE